MELSNAEIKKIIDRKKSGTDCTEQESAEIKMYVKEHLVQAGTEDVSIMEDIQTNFPIEYGEGIDEQSLEKGGKAGKDKSKHIKARLEYLRKELRSERISYGELLELQSLKEHIDPSDVELLQASGVPEFPDEDSGENGDSMGTGGKAGSISFADYYANHGAIITGGSYFNVDRKEVGGLLVGLGLGLIGGYTYRNEINKAKEKAKDKIVSGVESFGKGGNVSEGELQSYTFTVKLNSEKEADNIATDYEDFGLRYASLDVKGCDLIISNLSTGDSIDADHEATKEFLDKRGLEYKEQVEEYEKGGAVYSQKRVGMTKRGRGIDSKVRAHKAGWRKSKQTGDWYFERRENRSDRSPKHKK